MDFKEMIKYQLISGKGGTNMYTFLYIFMIEKFMTFLSVMFNLFKTYAETYYEENWRQKLTIVKKDEVAIFLEKDLNVTNDDTKIDSVIDYISTLCNVQTLTYLEKIYILSGMEPFSIDDHIKCKLCTLNINPKSKDIRIKLFSFTRDISYVRKFIDDIHDQYKIGIQNKLGKDSYFFDHIISTSNNNVNPPFISFNKNKFVTSRTLENVFFEERLDVLNRVKFFMDNKSWYDKKGIPYTLGFMFYGLPGTGKTSCIKAISNMTGRHIINISFDELKTKTQLKNLFYDTSIHVSENLRMDDYTIPMDKRIYVIEDIDAMNSIVTSRDKEESEEEEENDMTSEGMSNMIGGGGMGNMIGGGGMGNMIGGGGMGMTRGGGMGMTRGGGMNNMIGGGGILPKSFYKDEKKRLKEEAKKDKLTMATVLNVLDGTLEVPGRIIIITTNHPEKIDSALIRPGRIDMIINFKLASKQIIKEMYEGFYDLKYTEELDDLPDYFWSPAEINAILFKNFNNPEYSIVEIKSMDKSNISIVV